MWRSVTVMVDRLPSLRDPLPDWRNFVAWKGRYGAAVELESYVVQGAAFAPLGHALLGLQTPIFKKWCSVPLPVSEARLYGKAGVPSLRFRA